MSSKKEHVQLTHIAKTNFLILQNVVVLRSLINGPISCKSYYQAKSAPIRQQLFDLVRLIFLEIKRFFEISQ